jgi:hypothetical protein
VTNQMETLLTSDILDVMRKVGDPRFDQALSSIPDDVQERLIKNARKDGLDFLRGNWLAYNSPVYGFGDLLYTTATLPDPDLVKTACDLFARYGSEIAAALLLQALPESYASGEGAKVLAQHSQLAEGGTLSTKRILATAQFVIWILTPGPANASVNRDLNVYKYPSFDDTSRLWGPGTGQALRASLALRVMHSLIRSGKSMGIQDPSWNAPRGILLNQEDLLATLLSFSITVFETLEQFGINWTEQEQEAFFYVWDRVGETLGIGDVRVIETLTGAASLADLKKSLREFDEGKTLTPHRPVVPTHGSQVTSVDIDNLFRGSRNRHVLRRVADAGTLRPRSVPEARALLARLRERMWTLENDSFPQREPFCYENFKRVLDDVSPGRILLKALVDELAGRLPTSQKTWPVSVIRQLVPQQVQNRLALGGSSSLGFISGILGTPRDAPGPAALRRVTAQVLRWRATRVSNALFLHYYDKGELTIPGLRSTQVGYGAHP